MIVWCSLYYFVFEMRKFKIKVESENHFDCFQRMKNNRKMLIGTIMIYNLFVVCPEMYIVLLESYLNPSDNKDNYAFRINSLLIIRTIVKAIIEIFMFTHFLKLILFFIGKKKTY